MCIIHNSSTMNKLKFLYIFPHPDDESFGPAPVMYRSINEGHEVHLLTLTKGGATKVRHQFGYSIKEMGEIREQELHEVSKLIPFTSMTILNHQDGGMAKSNPILFEQIIKKHIEKIEPNIVVTYPIHGISGHHDHLACHAIVKRVYVDMKEKYNYLKRLAFLTIPTPDENKHVGGMYKVNTTRNKDVDCEITLNKNEVNILKKALDCYGTYSSVIKETNVINDIGNKVYFEFYNENFNPRVTSINGEIN